MKSFIPSNYTENAMFKTVKLLAIAALIMTNVSHSMDQAPVITPYNDERDYPAVKAILAANDKELLYPGQPLEYTARFFTSPKYKTDVLRIGDKTVGFVNYCVFDRTFLWMFTWYRTSLLHLMGVSEEHRRKGYAQMLAQHAIEYCEKDGATEIYIQTTLDNTPALKLYKKLGFVQMGVMLKRALQK